MLHKNSKGENCALVSSIQHYTIHDGPGIRTAIFFTGCTMNCLWCSNPETIRPEQQLGIYRSKCLSKDKCGYCVKICPLHGEPISFDEERVLCGLKMAPGCKDCLKCADICPPRAIKLWGDKMTLPELMKIIEGDRNFYDRSGGGVTLNGGEVMMQWEFAQMLLQECKDAGINTCVETALHCQREHMEAVYQNTDLVIADIKHMDSEIHRSFAGVGNELVLSNLKKTVQLGKKLVIRTPVVPGYNGDEQSIRAIARFIKEELRGEIIVWQLLPYRKMGTEKYESLMLEYPLKDYVPMERSEWEKELSRLAAMIQEEYNLPAEPGTGGKLGNR